MTQTNPVMTLRPKPWQAVLLLVVGCCLVAGGVFTVAHGYRLYGWMAIVFFGIGVVFACAMFLPGGNSLRLTPEGMEIYSLFRKTSVRWADIREFSLVSVPVTLRTLVGWNFVASYPRDRISRKTSAFLAGVEAALPNSFGMSAESLCALLSEWRNKYAATSGRAAGLARQQRAPG